MSHSREQVLSHTRDRSHNLSKSTHIQHHQMIRLASDPLGYLCSKASRRPPSPGASFRNGGSFYLEPQNTNHLSSTATAEGLFCHTLIFLTSRKENKLRKWFVQHTGRRLCKNLWRISTRTKHNGYSTLFPLHNSANG